MRELADKITKDRQQKLDGMLAYLHNSGLDATLTEESTIDRYGESVNETIIRLRKQKIHKIRLGTTEYDRGSEGSSVSSFHYEIVCDKPLTSASKKIINAKIKLVKEKKLLGLFGGKVVDIKWAGRDIAEALNSDIELSRLLIESATGDGSDKLRIQTKSQSVVEILGPAPIESPLSSKAEMIKTKAGQEAYNKPFKFEIYSRIAGHINDMLDASTRRISGKCNEANISI